MTTFPEPEPLDTGTPQQVDEDALLADVAEQVDDLEQLVDITPLDHPRRILLVHAHPDDETVGTGATIARYVEEHALVVVVTCTRGELGEVVDPALADLASTGPDDDRLGEHRVGELAAAMEALGVREHRFLGGPGRFRDSGMMGEPTNDDPRCFWQADEADTVGALVGLVREFRPQVLVTYDANGGYGHPDHIQAHRVTTAAFDAAGDPAYAPVLGEPWQTSRLYHTAIPDAFLQRAVELGVLPADESQRPRGVPDSEIDAVIDGTAQMGAKVAAMRAHRSQIDLTQGLWHALVAAPEFAIENYVLASGDRLPGDGEHGWQSDLFAKE